jgi:hypothetical protein
MAGKLLCVLRFCVAVYNILALPIDLARECHKDYLLPDDIVEMLGV